MLSKRSTIRARYEHKRLTGSDATGAFLGFPRQDSFRVRTATGQFAFLDWAFSGVDAYAHRRIARFSAAEFALPFLLGKFEQPSILSFNHTRKPFDELDFFGRFNDSPALRLCWHPAFLFSTIYAEEKARREGLGSSLINIDGWEAVVPC